MSLEARAECTAQRRTVMVVDDEHDLCDILRDIFEDEGWAVGIANNGVEALALLHRLPAKPCIVILDMFMPVLDGAAVYRAMRADPSLADMPVVVATSDPSQAPRGVPVLRKPVSLSLMLDTVRKACGDPKKPAPR